MAAHVYDFNLVKVQDTLVSHLRARRREATVADLVAGTGLPTFQVEQGLRGVLAEYAGHLKASESGELVYYFPSPMQSTTRGLGPAFRRGFRAFRKGAATVLSFLFKIWIVTMLVGYFVVFLAVAVAAVVAALAASMAGSKDRRGRGSGPSGQGMVLVARLFDLVLRMWFWSNLAGGGRRGQRPREGGAPFYKSVFSFVFGDPDPNREHDGAITRYMLAYLRAHRGVITLEEVMATTGRDAEGAQRLLNRWLVEFEGDPRATDDGTVVYAFPGLLKTTADEQRRFVTGAIGTAPVRLLVPFSTNKPRTNGWIVFLNLFNLLFGGYFLFVGLAPQAATSIGPNFTFVFRVAQSLLAYVGVTADTAGLLAWVLGAVPLAFSALLYLVPLVRRGRLARVNEQIRAEGLARRIYARVLAGPSRVDPRELRPLGAGADPARFEAARKRIFDRFAGAKGAEPEALGDGGFVYRFADLEREKADLERYRASVDLAKLRTGATVFDSGK
jgi:hypothetical protein